MNKIQTMTKVAELLSFIKDQVKVDLIEASGKNLINVERPELERIARLISLSIDSNFTKGSSIIESNFKK